MEIYPDQKAAHAVSENVIKDNFKIDRTPPVTKNSAKWSPSMRAPQLKRKKGANIQIDSTMLEQLLLGKIDGNDHKNKIKVLP